MIVLFLYIFLGSLLLLEGWQMDRNVPRFGENSRGAVGGGAWDSVHEKQDRIFVSHAQVSHLAKLGEELL